MNELNSRLRWLIALRLLIVFSISTPYALYWLSTPEDMPLAASVLRILVSMVSVLTLIFIACLRLLRELPEVHAYLQFSGDLLTVTLLLYRLGEAAQNFSILYLVVISVASVLLRRSAGRMIATAAFALFTAVTFAPWFGWMIGAAPKAPSYETEELVYRLVVHLIGFYAIAFLTSFLAQDVVIAEERLRKRDLDLADLEVAHRDIVESISSGLVTTDREGRIIRLNRAAEGILETQPQGLLRRNVTETDLVSDDQWSVITGTTDGRLSWEVTRHYGERIAHLGLSVTLLRDGQGTHRGYILVIDDLTDEHRLRNQLRVQDRMAAIGEMAAGLAHEVGNPLAAISGSVQVLSRSMGGDAAQAKLLNITLKESQRLDRTVKSFLQLAASREFRWTAIDIAALIAEDIQLLKLSDDVQDNHQLIAELDPESAVIRADADQIGQIFWNLARNALRAMPDGGTLIVRGRLGETVYTLEFHDTGRGMSEQEQADLFHPFKSFFDQGTGIGMAIVYRLVEEHGGKITAESDVDVGTVIRVTLPIAGPTENLL
jgi:two-component system sensor histidine kinase PilS (NtrC family)